MGAALAVGCLVLVGVPGGARAQPAGELRIGVPRLPETLDPVAATTGPALMVSRQLFQGLVTVGERGELEPGLATQWTVSRDGLTWTFRLRADAQFHDGTPLTADIVVASLSRHLAPDEAGGREPATPWARVFRGGNALVREVRRGDPGTVEILLNQPFSPLLAVLAHPALAIGLTQNDSGVPFLGTGPYRLAARVPGRLVLEAVSPARGDPPRSARLVFEEMPDDALALAEFGPRGRLDVHFPQSPPAWGGLGLQVLSAPTWQVGFLALRSQAGLLAKKPLRRVVALALDPALVGPALGRWARPWASYLPPGAWAVRDALPPAHDPASARRLLAEARMTQAAVSLLAADMPGGLDLLRLAEAIRLSLAVAGLRVEVRQLAGDAYVQALRDGEGELALLESALEVDDPHFAFRPLVASELAARGSATNVAFYRNAFVDDLLLRASQIAFRPERLRLYHRLQAHLADERPYIPLYVRLQWAVARPSVRDLRLDPAGRHRLDRVWVEAPPEPVPAPPVVLPPAAPTIPVPPPPLPPGSSP